VRSDIEGIKSALLYQLSYGPNLCTNPAQYCGREHLSSLGSVSDSDRVI
jgi:hypothetical protein